MHQQPHFCIDVNRISIVSDIPISHRSKDALSPKAPSVRLCTTTFSFVSFSDCGSEEVLLELKELRGRFGAQGQQRQGLRNQIV